MTYSTVHPISPPPPPTPSPARRFGPGNFAQKMGRVWGGNGEWELEVGSGDWRVGSSELRAGTGKWVVSERVVVGSVCVCVECVVSMCCE